MALVEWKDAATIFGIVVGVVTYLTNSYFQFKNKRIENLKKYFDAHDKPMRVALLLATLRLVMFFLVGGSVLPNDRLHKIIYTPEELQQFVINKEVVVTNPSCRLV